MQRPCNGGRFLVLSKKSKKTCVAAEEVREVTPVRSEKNQLPYNHIGPYHDKLLFRVKWGTLFWVSTNNMVWSDLLFKRITVTTGLKIDCSRIRVELRRLFRDPGN